MPVFGKATRRNAHGKNHSTAQQLQYDPTPAQQHQSKLQHQQHRASHINMYPYTNPATASTTLTLTQPQPFHEYSGWPAQTPNPASGIGSGEAALSHQSLLQYGNHQGLHDYIGDRLCDVVSWVDEDAYTAEQELVISFDAPPPRQQVQNTARAVDDSSGVDRSLVPIRLARGPPNRTPKCTTTRINVLSKVSLYANSRLPLNLPPLRLYIPSWPLICLAAEYSNNAYREPTRSEKRTYITADNRLGTKAMVIKSVPVDASGLVVFAIRGTSLLSLRDWNVNMSTNPVSPAGLLDDPGNLCHEGFLKVARAMLIPIATRLRQLLQENPSRSSYSLLITGHSAGGAVAALIYSHMLSESKDCQSELSILTGCFKRIHCLTFGAPPVTLLPLTKPPHSERRLQKSLFLSFINEGDVVCRAEKAYVRSLVELLASPAPEALQNALGTAASRSMLDLSLGKRSQPTPSKPPSKSYARWSIPPATLSNAGRLVLLRVPPSPKPLNKGKTWSKEEKVTASIVTDEQLRSVIFGDPFIHTMAMYLRRVKELATRAVMGAA